MLKKVISLLLAVVMVAAMFAGCASNTDTNKETAAAGKDAPAATSGGDTQKDEAPVSLRLVMYGNAGQRNVEFYKNELHQKVLDELNIDLTVDYVPWGEGSKMIDTMAASGEDFAFMSGPNVAARVSAGLQATFDPALFENAPNYMKYGRNENAGFADATYNGEIYVIPGGYQITAALKSNYVIRNDLLNEVGWDYTQITDYDTLMAAIADFHDAHPEMKVINGSYQLVKLLRDVVAPDGQIFEVVNDSDITAVDVNDPNSDEVISWLESDYFKNYCNIAKEWYDLGYITVEDMADQQIGENAWKSGNCLMKYGAPTALYDHDPTGIGIDGVDVQYLTFYSTPHVISMTYNWGWAMSKAGQDKTDDLIRFIEWVYSSKENFLFCTYGVEGTDWEYDEYGLPKKLTSDDFLYNWVFISEVMNPPSTKKYDAAEVEAYLHIGDDAIKSKAIGFLFDPSSVEAEAAAINAIISEKVKPFTFGIQDYETEFPAVLEELKDAGLDAYVAEYQRQFSEFMANK